MKVRLYINDDGYIDGWGSDYTDDNQYDIADEELNTIYIGASKLVDGHITLDEGKKKEIEEANAKLDDGAKPVDYQAIIAQLKLEQGQTNEALLEISDMVLAATSASTTTEEAK